MKILWITNDILPEFIPFAKGNPTKGGSWITPLFYSLGNIDELTMGVVTPIVNGENQKQEIRKNIYYAFPIKKGDNRKAMTIELADSYKKVINDFNPDIIHVHGTEVNFGQIINHIDKKIPVVCSIQGIINSYLPALKSSMANIEWNKYFSVKNRFGRGGEFARLKIWNKYKNIEYSIIKNNKYFIGRTIWDKAQVLEINKHAYYFHGEELLRSKFYKNEWKFEFCNKYQIFISSSAYPIKGFHVLLKAVALLKDKYPEIKVVAPLSNLDLSSSKIKDYLIRDDYHNYVKSLVYELSLTNNLKLCGRLSEEEMVDQYREAHIFVMPSFIENSPNSLGEAMMIGTPTIVSPVGGIPSIVKDELSTLFFSVGDHATLALQIDRIFEDHELSQKLSINAKNIAKLRHDLNKSTIEYIENYKKIVKIHNESSSYF